ncbi:uncharacterized protein MELLADRAFT_123222 [Melampsora larici-populina 98AG31]|uniref:Secreted protein n=1 Tax=Melampsora larici-populina (strain 98AG31 / pathotype 3-4-7) TaxID=747676 RepID=F4R463_MELLP|nr:uncharacterized protein MELLADRAFT_123222 [Melampsora larici-populina 98AG31]EGG13050.1 secreted protein [Melampsora larici-populina 98AG31]
MLSFQSPHRLCIIFISIWITQVAFTLSQTATVKCTYAFGILSPAYFAACRDDDANAWVCPTASCQRDGSRWVPMKNCTIKKNGDGTSDQQCTRYVNHLNGNYVCTNSGGHTYLCPYKPENVPYITCTECTKSKPPPV